MNCLMIPAALQINMDDVGWWCGRDDRRIGGPSRTGMPRQHCVADYQAIADLGKELNMRINCAFVLGEWDLQNRLGREIPYFSHFGEGWSNAAFRRREDLEQAAQIIRNSPYVGIALHGLYHGYYMPGTDNHDCSDYWYYLNGRLHMVPEEQIRCRIEHFLRICEEFGFDKRINSYIPPSFRHKGFSISEILKEYGIQYIFTHFDDLNINTPQEQGRPYDSVLVENGIITVDQKYHPIPWNAVDANFVGLPPSFGILSPHWPNYLNSDPEKHAQTRERIVPYFKKCSQTYGIILSKDCAFAATQELYKKYAKLLQQNGSWIIDLSDVPVACGAQDSFYISVRKRPLSIDGCSVGNVEQHEDFVNYEIFPQGKFLRIAF